PPHADRVSAARAAREARRQGADAPPAPARRMGSAQHAAHALPSRAHGGAAPQDRRRPGAPALARHRGRRRLPATRRTGLPSGHSCGSLSAATLTNGIAPVPIIWGNWPFHLSSALYWTYSGVIEAATILLK